MFFFGHRYRLGIDFPGFIYDRFPSSPGKRQRLSGKPSELSLDDFFSGSRRPLWEGVNYGPSVTEAESTILDGFFDTPTAANIRSTIASVAANQATTSSITHTPVSRPSDCLSRTVSSPSQQVLRASEPGRTFIDSIDLTDSDAVDKTPRRHQLPQQPRRQEESVDPAPELRQLLLQPRRQQQQQQQERPVLGDSPSATATATATTPFVDCGELPRAPGPKSKTRGKSSAKNKNTATAPAPATATNPSVGFFPVTAAESTDRRIVVNNPATTSAASAAIARENIAAAAAERGQPRAVEVATADSPDDWIDVVTVAPTASALRTAQLSAQSEVLLREIRRDIEEEIREKEFAASAENNTDAAATTPAASNLEEESLEALELQLNDIQSHQQGVIAELARRTRTPQELLPSYEEVEAPPPQPRLNRTLPHPPQPAPRERAFKPLTHQDVEQRPSSYEESEEDWRLTEEAERVAKRSRGSSGPDQATTTAARRGGRGRASVPPREPLWISRGEQLREGEIRAASSHHRSESATSPQHRPKTPEPPRHRSEAASSSTRSRPETTADRAAISPQQQPARPTRGPRTPPGRGPKTPPPQPRKSISAQRTPQRHEARVVATRPIVNRLSAIEVKRRRHRVEGSSNSGSLSSSSSSL